LIVFLSAFMYLAFTYHSISGTNLDLTKDKQITGTQNVNQELRDSLNSNLCDDIQNMKIWMLATNATPKRKIKGTELNRIYLIYLMEFS
jgi:hypothetical protein